MTLLRRIQWLNSAQQQEIRTLASRNNPTEPKLSGETIDLIAIDSLKWHIADEDMEPLQLEAFRIVLRYYGASV
jgi:hypothetical protein